MKRSPFIESVRKELRTRHYSLQTEKMGNHEIERFFELSRNNPWSCCLNTKPSVMRHHFSVSVRNKAGHHGLILLLCKTRKNVYPQYLSPGEVNSILKNCSDKYWLIIALLYSCEFRVSEVPTKTRPRRWNNNIVVVPAGSVGALSSFFLTGLQGYETKYIYTKGIR